MTSDHDPRSSLESALAAAVGLLAQKEQELAEARRSEDRYRSLVEKVLDLVFCVDRHGRITFVNSASLLVLAYRPEELVGQHFSVLLTEESRTIAQDHFRRNMEGPGPRMVYELEFLGKDERRIPMEIHGTNVYEDGEVVGVRAIARDISGHLRAEEQQRHRYNQLRAINQVGQQIVAVLDPDDLLPYLVELLRESFGYHYVTVFMRDEAGEYMVCRASSGAYGQPLPAGSRLKIGEQGIVGWVARTGEPALMSDVHRDPRYFAPPGIHRTETELAVPVKLGDQVVGVLDIQSDRHDAFDEADQWVAQTLADQIAVAIRNAELFEAEKTRRQETSLILEITRAVTSTLLLGEVLQLAADGIARAVGNLNCGIYLLDEEGANLIPGAGSADAMSTPIGERFMSTPLELAGDPFFHDLMASREPIESVNVEADPRVASEITRALGIKSLLAVPLVSRDQVLGVAMVVSLDSYYDFTAEEIQLAAGIANSVALAIDNARLYQGTRELGAMEERNRLAREIHDTIAQGLTGIVLQLEAADQLLDANPERGRMRVRRATELARGSLQEARRSVWDLRPRPLEEKSLVEAIGQEVERLSDDGGMVGRLQASGEPGGLSGEAENGLFRILQEALSNVRKHSHASHVDVELAYSEAGVVLRVRDDGDGFDPDAVLGPNRDGGFGLLSLQERARLLKGAVKVESASGEGTLVEVTVPRSEDSGLRLGR